MSKKKRPRDENRPTDTEPAAARDSSPRKPLEKKSSRRGKSKPSGGSSDGRLLPSASAVRETIESVVIAFVLAFLFRTFDAEAFVIPTGSMAPTLMGRHKDLVCPKCGYPFQVSASEEVESGGALLVNPKTGRLDGSLNQVVQCMCPMCRYTIDVGPDNALGESYPSYKGDRILVGKFPYQFNGPERWDVAVFKFPGGAKTNYIKRIVGLPNETIHIEHGDLFVERMNNDDETETTIARKPPKKLLAMLQPVYDNRYVVPEMLELGWPPRWSGQLPNPSGGDWSTEDHRLFETDGSSDTSDWLRYRHLLPLDGDWKFLAEGKPSPNTPRPQLISDFCGYNTGRSLGGVQCIANGDTEHTTAAAAATGQHWVGDLAVRCRLEVVGTEGEVVFQLVEGGRKFECSIDTADGRAAMTIVDQPDAHQRTALTDVRGPGTYQITFSNVDDQLMLWVDGETVEFDQATTYLPLGNTRPTEDDLAPVGIASRGAAVKIDQLELLRDIYYIAVRSGGDGDSTSLDDYPRSSFLHSYGGLTSDRLARFMSTPELWGEFDKLRHVEFPLTGGKFLVLGDNSLRSKDSRLWEHEGFGYFVRRELLIGKAIFIYWPHSWDRVTVGGVNIPFPFFPNYSRWGFVR